ncbi:MAG: TlpA family protein disulfide reductase [Acidobacteria bacterium]|nr:TlpA family protein disulfide reductase [Acidobacteriota bacterium]MBK7933267.1 TlpA family protein disulfide reductase [Acidobacteriota bacterium]
MKSFLAFVILLFGLSAAIGQNEQAPIVEKEITYKNWTYKSIRTGEEVDLRDAAAGKKLVIVVYYAPWCGNWRFDAPMLKRLYEKYKGDGLEIIAVGEYDPLASMKTNLETLKIPFPAVYESENRTEKQKTLHYRYRTMTGDFRGWGSPWYIFLEPAKFEKKGDTLVNRTHVINGEMIEAEGEKFIREKLALPAVETKGAVADNGKVEVCDPDKPTAITLKKP